MAVVGAVEFLVQAALEVQVALEGVVLEIMVQDPHLQELLEQQTLVAVEEQVVDVELLDLVLEGVVLEDLVW